MKARTAIPKAASEAQISRSIMDYLAARHVFAMRMNSGTRIGSYKGKNWAIHRHEPGTANILALPHLPDHNLTPPYVVIVPLWIEVKDATGKQSDLQASFQEQVEREGHKYIVACSIEDVEAAL